MAWWKVVISQVVIAGIAFGVGYYAGGCGGVEYKWKTKTKIVEKVKWYKEKCGDTIIDGRQNKKDFLVTVENNCFKGNRLLSVDISCPSKDNLIMPSITSAIGFKDGKFDALIGGELSYIRMFGMFGFGGGLSYQHSVVFKNDYYGAKISGALKF